MKKYIPLLALTAINCKDPSNQDLEILVKEATTNSQGIANHYDDQSKEDVPVYIFDSETEQPIEGVLVTFADSNRFEAFSVSDPNGNYFENFKCRDHNSGLDLELFAKSDNLVYWDSIHESNPDDVSALDEWSESIEDGSFDEYQYLGCYSKEELEAQADNAMKVLKIGAGLTSGQAGYEFVSKMESIKDQLELIADILADYELVDKCDYFDYYVANNWTMSELLVCREEPCESVDVCTGDELFCDDFNGSALDSGKWPQVAGEYNLNDGYLFLEVGGIQTGEINFSGETIYLKSPVRVNSNSNAKIGFTGLKSDYTSSFNFGINNNNSIICSTEEDYFEGDIDLGDSFKELELQIGETGSKGYLNGEEVFNEPNCNITPQEVSYVVIGLQCSEGLESNYVLLDNN
ncbi:hypothetical protein HN385_02255 [archaeon]|nr:hypothetical protein [archaeon]MBT3450377.1 hypothetical protein [archaeon]MBT6868848.1 hypothetical protein [archaeon]MBT7192931.1 hypothetical protein [archaeon]MBT7380897.1 hypothetical protein [archaeon]